MQSYVRHLELARKGGADMECVRGVDTKQAAARRADAPHLDPPQSRSDSTSRQQLMHDGNDIAPRRL